MLTKVRAARLAARSGTQTLIAHGKAPRIMERLSRGEVLGTWLTSDQAPVAARKQWLAGLVRSSGTLVLDDGAVDVLSRSGSSLLPVGVKSARGDFVRGDMVICVDAHGREIARGLVNYNLDETSRLLGQASSRIEELLGYQGDPELIHRDNLVLSR
jgi:glutamate 5-kinase